MYFAAAIAIHHSEQWGGNGASWGVAFSMGGVALSMGGGALWGGGGISLGGKHRSCQAWITVCSNTTSRLFQRQRSKNFLRTVSWTDNDQIEPERLFWCCVRARLQMRTRHQWIVSILRGQLKIFQNGTTLPISLNSSQRYRGHTSLR